MGPALMLKISLLITVRAVRRACFFVSDQFRFRPCVPSISMDIRDVVRLRKAKDRMDREFDQPLDVPALARSAAMSTGHFSRSFKAAFGEGPYSYLMTRRIERAKALLRRGDMSVTDACFAVGCTSLGSFSSRFTELVGESPSAYRGRSHSAAAVIPDH